MSGIVRKENFYKCDYDLLEIQRAIGTDSYLKVAVQKYKQLFFKAGYVLRGKNDSAIDYLKKRFRVMQYCTGCSIDRLLRNVAADLESYSNAFLIKTRQKEIPLINAKGIVASGNPVAGYYRVHPASMQAQYNDDGILIGYKQRITSGKEKIFSKDDVIHFTLDQDAGTIWGTPRWIASLEDIKLLRKVEANVIALVYRFAMPLFHMKVGLPQTGFRGTKKEVEDAKNTIERTPMDGMLVTTEATEIKAVGAEGNALDVTGYLSYFEKRVFSALNMSDAMMGRGGAKQDASSMEELVHNIIKDDQQMFSLQLQESVITELLLEGGFNPILNEEDIVTFDFNEVSLDTKIKMENNELNKFEKNAITFTELRGNLGLPKENVDESLLYANFITQANTLEQMEQQSDAAIELAQVNGEIQEKIARQTAAATKAAASDKSSSSSTSSGTSANKNSKRTKSSYTKKNTGNGKTKNTASKSKAVSSTNRPSNQHGTYSMKVKESLKQSDDSPLSLNNIYDRMSKEIANSSKDMLDMLLAAYKKEATDSINSRIETMSIAGSKKAFEDTGTETGNNNPNFSYTSESIKKYTIKALNELFSDIEKYARNNTDRIDLINRLDTIKYRANFISDYVENKTFWYSYMKTLSFKGIEKAKINGNESSRHRDEHHGKILDTRNFSLNDIPGYSTGCQCYIEPVIDDINELIKDSS